MWLYYARIKKPAFHECRTPWSRAPAHPLSNKRSVAVFCWLSEKPEKALLATHPMVVPKVKTVFGQK